MIKKYARTKANRRRKGGCAPPANPVSLTPTILRAIFERKNVHLRVTLIQNFHDDLPQQLIMEVGFFPLIGGFSFNNRLTILTLFRSPATFWVLPTRDFPKRFSAPHKQPPPTKMKVVLVL